MIVIPPTLIEVSNDRVEAACEQWIINSGKGVKGATDFSNYFGEIIGPGTIIGDAALSSYNHVLLTKTQYKKLNKLLGDRVRVVVKAYYRRKRKNSGSSLKNSMHPTHTL